MIVYVEGVDGSGKSTFAKALAAHLQDPQFNFKFKVHPKGEKLMVTHPWRLDRINSKRLQDQLTMCLLSPDVYIVDRGELSDIIYRTFDFEKYSSLMTLKQFFRIYMDYSDRYIMVHCDSAKSEPLMLARGEDNPVSISEHQKLRYLFNQIMPLFNAIKFDAGYSIENPSYLPAVCANVGILLKLKGGSNG